MSVGWPAAAYARSFGVLCAGPVPELITALGTGRRLLDAGCGPGTLARAAADRFGTVHAVDLEPAMLALAPRPVVRADLHRLPHLDATFDAVGANFAVNHSPDPRAAVAELVRVSRPGGRVAATIWPSTGATVNTLWNAVIDRAGLELPLTTPLPPERDFDRDVPGFAALLTGAGLAQVQSRLLTWTFRIGPDDLWQAAAAGVASIGALFLSLDPGGRARLRDAYEVEVAHSTDARGRYQQVVTALLASGRRP